MLEAGDIILIVLGCMLVLAAGTASVCAALYCQRKNEEQKKAAAEERRKETLEYYVDQPTIHREKAKADGMEGSQAAANGQGKAERCSAALARVFDPPQSKNAVIEVDETARGSGEVVVDPPAPIPPKRTGRQDRIVQRPEALSIGRFQSKAATVEAIETEHRLSEFLDVMDVLNSSSRSVIQEEYQILERRDSARRGKCSVAEANKMKNRFADILPYDDSRVQLPDDVYINASLIDGHFVPGQFIATQGPISREEGARRTETESDFWFMVWHQKAEAIVMLTDCTENMRSKCAQYWPTQLGSSHSYNGLTVTLMAGSQDPICEKREFDVTMNGETRQLCQYHLRVWQDARAVDSSHLLDFIERIKDNEHRKPIVVHCSAGVGRTGVFIAVWRLLDRARQEALIDVFSVVDSMRSQRKRMVQTEEQYESIYDVVATALRENRI